MNEHIEVVKKWITGEAVSHEQLKTNFEDASQDYYAYAAANAGTYDTAWSLKAYANCASAAAYDSATTTAGAIAASNAAFAADHWVKRYEELTNE
tara:strand:+ start:452 stop:736 length:285 start_codon:yes stop_codon:yes gene_type:complete